MSRPLRITWQGKQTPVLDFHIHVARRHCLTGRLNKFLKTIIRDETLALFDNLTLDPFSVFMAARQIDKAVALAEYTPQNHRNTAETGTRHFLKARKISRSSHLWKGLA